MDHQDRWLKRYPYRLDKNCMNMDVQDNVDQIYWDFRGEIWE